MAYPTKRDYGVMGVYEIGSMHPIEHVPLLHEGRVTLDGVKVGPLGTHPDDGELLKGVVVTKRDDRHIYEIEYEGKKLCVTAAEMMESESRAGSSGDMVRAAIRTFKRDIDRAIENDPGFIMLGKDAMKIARSIDSCAKWLLIEEGSKTFSAMDSLSYFPIDEYYEEMGIRMRLSVKCRKELRAKWNKNGYTNLKSGAVIDTAPYALAMDFFDKKPSDVLFTVHLVPYGMYGGRLYYDIDEECGIRIYRRFRDRKKHMEILINRFATNTRDQVLKHMPYKKKLVMKAVLPRLLPMMDSVVARTMELMLNSTAGIKVTDFVKPSIINEEDEHEDMLSLRL